MKMVLKLVSDSVEYLRLNFKFNFQADRHAEAFYQNGTGSSYMNTANFRSEIYMKKGDEAYYKTESNSTDNQ